MITSGRFREDLWFRLNVFPITIPPLRQRREDIPALVHHFIDRKSVVLKLAERPVLAPGAIDRLIAYDWPGNVRELENELRRVFILESEYEFEAQPAAMPSPDSGSLRMEAIERNAILKALEATRGNKSKAAEMLGMARRTFYDKLEKYQIS
jgi:DNA-binding NtrC family response regulator